MDNVYPGLKERMIDNYNDLFLTVSKKHKPNTKPP